MPLLPLPSDTTSVQERPNERVVVQTADFGDPPPPQSQAEFFDSFSRVLPKNYVDGLKSGGGSELLQGVAAVAARAALSVSRWDSATIAGYARMGAKAKGRVYLWRDSAAAGEVTVKQGTIVGTKDQRLFFLRSDVHFGIADLGPFAVAAEAMLPGYEYNVDGEHLNAIGEIVPGQITEIYTLLEDPDFGDPSIRVRNVEVFEGGIDAQLEQLAEDRGLAPPHASETEAAFRLRIKSVVRGVALLPLQEAARNILRQWGPRFQCTILSAWDFRWQTGYDCLIPGTPTFPPTTFVYDDPRPPAFSNFWLNNEGANGGFFVVGLSWLPCLDERGFFLDDTPNSVPQYATPGTDGGRRAASFLSLPDVMPFPLAHPHLGARDPSADGCYASIYKMLNDSRGGGDSFEMYLFDTP